MKHAQMENPFTPSFGTVPQLMAGRDELLRDMRHALNRANRDPLLSTILVGARGTGKTALLACVRQEAEQAGWVPVSTVALPGLLDDVLEQARMVGGHLIEPAFKHRLTSVGVGPLKAGWEAGGSEDGNWRTKMVRLIDQLEEHDSGLLITVDEVKVDFDEIVQLAATYQLLVTEGRKIALVMAGLPYQVHRLVAHKSISFLRRAYQYDLKAIADPDVEEALRGTFELGGKTITDEALRLCVDSIGGFPYLLQLVGYRTWIASGNARTVEPDAANRGIAQAMIEMDEHILAATYRDLSRGDVRYLQAMLPDASESRTSEIASRMGVSSGYASKYKARLLAQGVISEPARGWVAFEIPGFKKFLEERLA